MATKDTKLDKLAAELEDYKRQVVELRAAIAAGELDDAEVALEHDPYDEQKNAFAFKNDRFPPDNESPTGWVISWKSPKYRERRGWRGWIPLQYGDPFVGKNGENLDDHIFEPPKQLQGPGEIDSYVRRADLILCKIEAGVYDARQLNRERRAAKRRKGLMKQYTTPIRTGVTPTGPGLSEDPNPKYVGQGVVAPGTIRRTMLSDIVSEE